MYISKKHLYISIISIFIVTVGIVLFLKPIQMNNATEKMVDMLNEQYKEDFKVTWSDIDKQPSNETYTATVKSKNSGYVYDVLVKKGRATIDYKKVNDQMVINETIEAALPDSFVSVIDDNLVILTTSVITQQSLKPFMTQFTMNEAHIFQLNKENYDIATKHINQYYQRSTMPIEELNQYKPNKYTIKLNR